MKTVVLTGVSSFVGLHLGKALAARYRVVGVLSRARESYQGIRSERLQKLKNSIDFVTLDFTQKQDVEKIIEEYSPHYWIHHGGYVDNYATWDYQLSQGYRVNVDPLYHIYPQLKKRKCEGVIITGTSMEYGDGDQEHLESEICLPTTPYGLAKLFESKAAIQLAQKYDIPTRIARVFNPLGSFENPKKLLPYLIESLKSNRKVELSPCTQVRNFYHVDMLTDIYQLLLEDCSQGGSEIYNVAAPENITLNKLIVTVCDELEASQELLDFKAREMRSTEVLRCSASVQKLKEQLKYNYKISLPEEIKKLLNHDW